MNEPFKVLAVVGLFFLNAVFGFFASVLAVGGDGSAKGVYFVGSVFTVVNLVAIIWAGKFLVDDKANRAIAVALATSPTAFGVVVAFAIAMSLFGVAT